MSTLDPVAPGDPILARDWNVVAATVNDLQTPQLPGNDVAVRSPWIENQSDQNVEEFQCLAVTGPMFQDDADQYGDFRELQSLIGRKPLAADFGKFAIAATEIEANGGLGQIYRGPVMPARVNVTHDWHRRCDIDPGSHLLKSGPHGSAELLWKSAATGTDIRCLIRQVGLTDVTLLGKPTTDVNPAGSGTVTIWRGHPPIATSYAINNVRLQWMHGAQKVSAGKEVQIQFFADDLQWRIVGAECE